MTWWRDEEHYEVFFNRDELKTREPASPPELILTDSGVRYLSPSDPLAGGTWMLTNEHRVTICLLNRWHDSAPAITSHQSRGLLVSAMADCASASEVMSRLGEMDHTCYRPFTLVSLDPKEIYATAWNGELLIDELVSPPLTSSSYCFPEVAAARKTKYFSITDITPDDLRIYQQGESPASAYTVRMNRPDAQTWSRSHVSISSQGITWEYIEEPADLIGEGTLHTIELPL